MNFSSSKINLKQPQNLTLSLTWPRIIFDKVTLIPIHLTSIWLKSFSFTRFLPNLLTLLLSLWWCCFSLSPLEERRARGVHDGRDINFPICFLFVYFFTFFNFSPFISFLVERQKHLWQYPEFQSSFPGLLLHVSSSGFRFVTSPSPEAKPHGEVQDILMEST